MGNRCLKTKCFKCCIETNMLLTYHDIENIKKLGYDLQFFVKEYKGWLQLKNNKGRCVFHDGTRCIIYKYRPEGCTLYPVVYNADKLCAILDDECLQKYYFHASKKKVQQLQKLVHILEKERTARINKTIS